MLAPRREPSPRRACPEQLVERSPDGCWLWKGSKDRDGYGRQKHQGRWRAAHRMAYADAKGSIPDGMDIDHLCFVRLCVNPDHLEAVTRSENSRRMWAARKSA